MNTYPRTHDFPLIATSPVLPSDGAWLVAGDHIAADKSANAWGTLVQRSTGALELDDISGADCSRWIAVNYDVPADIVIRGALYWRHATGTAAEDISLGLMARLQAFGGAIDGTPPRWYAADAYLFRLDISEATDQATPVLARVNSGVITTLATGTAFDFRRGTTPRVELDVSGSTTVILEGKVDGVTVVTVNDSSASRISTAGRAGFLIERETTGASSTVSGCFRIRATRRNGGFVEYEDDFSRPNKKGDATYYPSSLWSDALPVTVENSGGSGRVNYAGTIGQEQSSLLQARVKSAANDYSVQADVIQNVGGSEFSLIVRGSRNGTGAGLNGFTGYLVTVVRPGASSWIVTTYRYENGAATQIAQDSVAQALASPYELHVRTWTKAGKVKIRPKLDGVTVHTAEDPEARRIATLGQVGFNCNRASGDPAIYVDGFQLNDDGDAAALGNPIPVLGEQYNIPVAPVGPYRQGLRGIAITSTRVGVGVSLLDTSSARVTIGGTRVKLITSGSPAVDECKVFSAGLGLIDLGFDPGDSPVLVDAIVGASSGVKMNVDVVPSGVNVTLPDSYVAGTLRLTRNGYELANTGGAATSDRGEFQETGATTAVLHEAMTGWLVADYLTTADSDVVINEDLDTQLGGGNRSLTVTEIANPETASLVVDGVRMTPKLSGTPAPDEFVPVGKTWFLGYAPKEDAHVRAGFVKADFSDLTLPITPSFVYEEVERIPSRSIVFDSLDEQISPLATKTRRLFRVRWQYIDESERDLLVGFLRARRGPLQQFSWTPPDEGSPVLSHMRSPKLEHSKVNPGVYRASCEFEELISP